MELSVLHFLFSCSNRAVLYCTEGCFFERILVYTFAVLGMIPGTARARAVNVQF